jgi:hypothetical protein
MIILRMNNKCTSKKIKECSYTVRKKICNPKTGRCVNKLPKEDNDTKKNTKEDNETKKNTKDSETKKNTDDNETKKNTDDNETKKITDDNKKEVIIKTKKTVLRFINEDIYKYDTFYDLIEQQHKQDEDEKTIINQLIKIEGQHNKSKKGFIYERVWDICIKLGVTDFTPNDDKEYYYEHGLGNINDKKLSDFKNIKDLFPDYIKDGYISGNSGGYSDITFSSNKKNNETGEVYKILYIVSVKYIDDLNADVKSYDIQNLCTIIEDRKEDYDEIKILLFVKDKEILKNRFKSANKSSNILIKYISPNGNYENVYDVNDLEKYYGKLKKLLVLYNYIKEDNDLKKFKEEYMKNVKKIFIPRFHQELFIEKINEMIENGENKILIGAIPRSGKTYIMAGTILKHVKEHSKKSENKNKFNKYIIITPSPSETLEQYEKAFNDYIDFDNYNIKVDNVKENNDNLNFNSNKNHTVFLISKQRLGYNKKTDENNMKKIEENVKKYFGNNTFNIIFMDEAHFGMSTEQAQQIIKLLDKNNVPKIFVTATYNKPNIAYGIEEHQKISWNLDDIKHIKKFDIDNFEEDIKHFYKKFSKNIVMNVLKNNGWNKKINNKDVIKNIMSSYKTFPEPYLITSAWDKDFLDNERQKIDNTDFSFDMEKLFTPKNTETFENTEQLEQLFYYYFGYPDKNISYAKQNFYKKRGILPRIQNICNNNCRTLQNYSHKTSQLWFLPYGTGRKIAEVTNCLLHFLNTKFQYIFNKHLFYVAIENDEKKLSKRFKPENVTYMEKPENIKKEIEKMEKDLNKDNTYEGLIILAGGRLHLGISLPNVDIVTMFSGISSSDSIYQMLFRSMTEIDEDIYCDGKSFCSQKKYGFMVDLNPQRTIYTLEYMSGELIDKTNSESEKKNVYNIISDLINIDKDVFVSNYGETQTNEEFVKELFDRLYKSWDAKIDSINNIVKQIDFDKAFIKLFEEDFDIRTFYKRQKGNTIQKPDEELKGPIVKIKKIFVPNKKNIKDEKILVLDILHNIITEVINILTIITSYNKFECLFNEKINIDDIDIKYEITKLLDDVNDDPLLKNIFINILKNRIIKDKNIDDEKIFNIIYNIITRITNKNIVGGNIISINKTIQQRKKKIYTIHEPDKLLLFIHDNLKPKDVERRERGEVFTPMNLVNEMLDTLPEDVWTNPDLKWLDPAAGMGNFPIAVYIRLMECLKILIPDEEIRRKHILEKMLYMVELDKSNVFMMRKILCGNKYKLNIFQGSFLDYKTDITFNIIIGNPPFQKTDINGNRKALLNNLWSIFIDLSFNTFLKKDGYLLFITPYSWMTPGFKYKEIFYSNYIIYLNINECTKWFDVGSTFSYYLIKKTNIKEKTNVICMYKNEIFKNEIFINNVDFLPILLTNECLSIIKKFYNNKIEKVSFQKSGELDTYFKKHLISECNEKIFKYKLRHTTTNTKLCSSIKHSLSDKNKILLNIPSYLDPLYDNGKLGITQNQMYLLTDNSKYIQILQSNLYKFIFEICKWSGFNSSSIFKNIPYIDNFISDEDLYILFKLTKKEIKIISKNFIE